MPKPIQISAHSGSCTTLMMTVHTTANFKNNMATAMFPAGVSGALGALWRLGRVAGLYERMGLAEVVAATRD